MLSKYNLKIKKSHLLIYQLSASIENFERVEIIHRNRD